MSDWTTIRRNLRYHWKTVLLWVILGSGLMLLMGCATKPLPPQVIAAANYGPAPPLDHQATTTTHLGTALIDPLSVL